ncbi:MAG: IscS subfamily cysteine desulfurase [archaeon]
MKVYLDNSATTKTCTECVRAMLPYFSKIYGNPSSIHHKGQEASEALKRARESLAKIIRANPEEIIFTSGGSEANNMAIKELSFGQKEKKHIITSKIEHPSVFETCKFLEKMGFKVSYIDVDKEGIIKMDEFKKAITKDTFLVTIMHANNEIGTIQPIKEIGALCKKHDIIFHTDAVQSFTKVLIDVKEMNIGLASFSSHKIHGPKGIGMLYKRKDIKLGKLVHGGHQEHNMRAGTENVAGAVGFAAAAQNLKQEDIDNMRKLRDWFIDEALKIPDTLLNGSREKRLCNNVSTTFKYIEGESLLLRLDQRGICVSTGSACTSQSLEPSHVLIAIGLPHEVAHGTIRFSLSKYTTKEELVYTIKQLKEIVPELRELSPLGGN